MKLDNRGFITSLIIAAVIGSAGFALWNDFRNQDEIDRLEKEIERLKKEDPWRVVAKCQGKLNDSKIKESNLAGKYDLLKKECREYERADKELGKCHKKVVEEKSAYEKIKARLRKYRKKNCSDISLEHKECEAELGTLRVLVREKDRELGRIKCWWKLCWRSE